MIPVGEDIPHLRMHRRAWNGVIADARRRHPEECCGLLLGRRSPRVWIANQIVCSLNIAADPRTAFQIDWNLLAHTLRRTQGTRREIIGSYHSHPNGLAAPSEADRRRAWPGHVCLIVALAADAPILTAWRPGPVTASLESLETGP